MFEPLLRAGAAAGFSLDTSSSKALAASLDAAVRGDDSYFNKLVRILATRCMTQVSGGGVRWGRSTRRCSRPRLPYLGMGAGMHRCCPQAPRGLCMRRRRWAAATLCSARQPGALCLHQA